MDWKPQIFKPKWKHKDPAVRAAAVRHEQDTELMRSLGEICRSDDAPQVRAAAAERVTDLGLLLAIHRDEKDIETGAALAARIAELATNTGPERPPLQDRLDALSQLDDRLLSETLAAQAPEAKLRLAALARVERQGLLGDCAIGDEHPDNRKFAAERITRTATLKRVMEAVRTSDKALYQHLRERIHAAALEAGDPAAVELEATRLCDALQNLVEQDDGKPQTGLSGIRKAWQALPAPAPPALQQRYGHILQRLQEPAAEPSPIPPQAQADEPVAAAPGPETVSSPNSDLAALARDLHQFAGAEELAGQKRINTLKQRLERIHKSMGAPSEAEAELLVACRENLSRLEARQSEQAQAEAAALESAEQALEVLGQALLSGQLHEALVKQGEVLALLKDRGSDRRWKPVSKALGRHYGRLRELRDWQHWSNDKIRKRLILDMEALPGSGLHPDAVLARIKEIQSEWKQLEASEQIPGDEHFAAAPHLWRRFQAAGRKAFQTTKPFLEKRSEVQDRHIEEIKEQCRQLDTLSGMEDPDWKRVNSAMAGLRKLLQELDSLPHRARQPVARRIKKSLGKANQGLQAHYADVEKVKLRLIREAAALTHVAERSEAISQAKGLQRQWRDAGRLWRSREQELWQAFREPLDPLFEQLQNEREQHREQQAARRAGQQALCEQLRTLLDMADEDLGAQQGKLQGLQDAWRDVSQPDRKLAQRFQTGVEQFAKRLQKHRERKQAQSRERWWLKSTLLRELAGEASETGGHTGDSGIIRDRWPEDGGDAVDLELNARFEALLSGTEETEEKAPEALLEAARQLCLQLEFLAGIASPPADREARMAYQVQRLSDSLTHQAERVPALEEAGDAERQWLLLDVVQEPDLAPLRKRVKAALGKIYSDE